MKVILCGYHWTGCKALDILLSLGYDIFVYTHEATKSVPDLQAYCRKRSIDYTTEKIGVDNLPFMPDIICSIYYRYIIDESVIRLVNNKIFNLHPALLPNYRGCSSLTWAMINGDSKCGYTYHYIEPTCDTGNIIIQKEVAIEEYDTQLTLYNRVMFLAMYDFEKALKKVIAGNPGNKQVGKGSYYKRGCPYDGVLTDDMDDVVKERFIRAMIYPPYPAAWYNGEIVETVADFEKMIGRKIIKREME